jgi:hypothetical protein
MQPFSKVMRCAVVGMLGVGLAGCSEYLDRRDALSVQSGNAVQTNKVAQMVDPWPPYAGNRNIAFNGSVMGSAVERYRTGRAILPVGNNTSASFQNALQNANAAASTTGQPTAPPPAVK